MQTQTSITVHRYERNVSPAIGKTGVCLFCSEQFNHPNHIGHTPKPRKQSPKQAAFWFFYRNAGFSWDPKTQTARQGKAETARKLAQAERAARQLGYTFVWEDDWAVGNHEREYGEAYANGEPETCEVCSMVNADGVQVQSLGCIDDATPTYRRVVEAELALEQLG